jgi:UrcA family protein
MKTFRIALITAITSSLAVATHASVSAPAPAPAPATESGSEIRLVGYADLDLSQDADVRRLYRRIRTAAREACGGSYLLAPVMSRGLKRCAEEATARAVARVNAPTLTRYHATLTHLSART